MMLLSPVAAGCGAVAGYFVVREQVRQSCPMSDAELKECREWFEGTARKMGALEWDQVMGSGRLMFIAFSRGGEFIHPEDLRKPFIAEASPEVAFLCSRIGTEPAALAAMVYAMAQVADRNHDGKISAQEFLMVWSVFCHFTLEENLGAAGTGSGAASSDSLERAIFNLADADGSGRVDFNELATWVGLLLALNLVPEEDRPARGVGVGAAKGLLQAPATAEEVARKYRARCGVSDDRALSRDEFFKLSQSLRLKGAFSDAVSVRKKKSAKS
jgi:hypothetical protein